MYSFEEITKLFSFALGGRSCIEIEFLVHEYPEYQSCWMGKMPDKMDREKEIYWFGLVPNGSEAYSYDHFPDFAGAPVFDGKSLREIWDDVEILSVDGCDPEDRFSIYLQ